MVDLHESTHGPSEEIFIDEGVCMCVCTCASSNVYCSSVYRMPRQLYIIQAVARQVTL